MVGKELERIRQMTYTAFGFYLFLVIVLLIYYTVPLRIRWVILLAASGAFYLIAYRTGWWIVLLSALLSYGAGLLLQHCTRYRRLLFGFAVILVSQPWFFIKK